MVFGRQREPWQSPELSFFIDTRHFIVFIANNEALSAGVRTTGELARRYVVKNKGKETYLYRDGERWFVEMKA